MGKIVSPVCQLCGPGKVTSSHRPPMPQFLHLQHGDSSGTCLTGCGKDETITSSSHIKLLLNEFFFGRHEWQCYIVQPPVQGVPPSTRRRACASEMVAPLVLIVSSLSLWLPLLMLLLLLSYYCRGWWLPRLMSPSSQVEQPEPSSTSCVKSVGRRAWHDFQRAL